MLVENCKSTVSLKRTKYSTFMYVPIRLLNISSLTSGINCPAYFGESQIDNVDQSNFPQ